jgi:phospholipase C
MPEDPQHRITRRTALRYGGALGGALALSGLPAAAWGQTRAMRLPDSLPDPTRPAGTASDAWPFDHIVVVMMENHSFDNLLGALALAGSPQADGLTFDRHGRARNTNPSPNGPVRAFPFPTTAQGGGVSQSWNATHEQIDGGAMDGFVTSVGSTQPMGYWTPTVLPFAYSLARSFTVANRWFCSAPCQTYPNRRFLMAGTAYGLVSTALASLLDPPPANGTIFDRLSSFGVSWLNYFTDFPQTAIIPSIIGKYPTHLAPITQFVSDCAAGSLPAVSFVDPEFGAVSGIGEALEQIPGLQALGAALATIGGDEEDPQDLSYGEGWAHAVLQAVLNSPAWPRTLLVYTYDEHGGYYDHVPPPAAIAPDSIAPVLAPGDAPGGYDLYGPRVPAVVVSPYSRPAKVSNAVCDHTSVLATIETKWNLPALTLRDANAATLAGFLNPRRPALLHPPELAAPPPPPPLPPLGSLLGGSPDAARARAAFARHRLAAQWR